MQLLPSKQIILRSPLKKAEALEAISQNTSRVPVKSFPVSQYNFAEDFAGVITPSGFQIRPVIKQGKNSFIPFITGDVRETLSGSEIAIDMRLHKAVRIFMSVWLTICAFACAGVAWVSVNERTFEPMSAIPLLMLCFGFALTHFAFNFSAKAAITDLKQLLSAKEQ
ncbi:MAG: hypothetical protein ACO1N9_13845 [Flavobacterium sp.]